MAKPFGQALAIKSSRAAQVCTEPELDELDEELVDECAPDEELDDEELDERAPDDELEDDELEERPLDEELDEELDEDELDEEELDEELDEELEDEPPTCPDGVGAFAPPPPPQLVNANRPRKKTVRIEHVIG